MYRMETPLVYMRLLAPYRAWVRIENRTEFWRDTGWLEKIVDRMSRYALFVSGLDHLQIAQRGSDITDVRNVMVKAAILTGDGKYRCTGYGTADLSSAWMFGNAGVTGYSAMAGRRPENLFLAAVDAGHMFFRSNWGEDGHFTYTKCDPLGNRYEHTDLTHISLHYRGYPMLVGSGRYSYVEEEPLRLFLESAQAHNVYVVGEEPHERPRGSQGHDSFGQNFENYYGEQGPICYGGMAYHGCLMSGTHYLIIHKVMAVDQGIWMIVNDIRYDGDREVREHYHLNDAIQRTPVGTGTGGAGECWRLCSGGGNTTAVLGPHPFEVVLCVMPKQYSQKKKSICLAGKTGFTNHATDWTCLFGEGAEAGKTQASQYGGSRPGMEKQVAAMNPYLSLDKSWNFLVWNQETWQGGRIHGCRGVSAYVKTTAIHTMDGNTILYRLRI